MMPGIQYTLLPMVDLMDGGDGRIRGGPNECTSLAPPPTPPSTNKIIIPQTGSSGFSWRKLWAFTGPGFLMSIAYLDPGNIQSDLQSGTQARYKLLWVLMWATILGLVMQRLAARLGVVTGLHLAEVCYLQYRTVPRIFLWLMMEVAIIGSDMQEVIGTAIALYLLSNKKIQLWVGVIITIVDTFTFLLLDKYGLRKLELLFAFLISVMAFAFGYEFFVVKPDTLALFEGLAIPWCENCDHNVLLVGIGIIGAVIMPHNLYLHSGLVKSREIDRSKRDKVKEANYYFFIEACIALFVSFVINVFVVAVFAHGLYQKTNSDVFTVCHNNNNSHSDIFTKNDTDAVDVNIYTGGVFLGCQFGLAAMYIWAIGILAAGQSSTMTGCYAGQFTMEGFLNLQWSRWKRVLFTRLVAIAPTIYMASYNDINDLSSMNDLLNAVMSLQLPFATFPVIAFTSNIRIMGDFANGMRDKIISSLLSAVVIGINITFVVSKMSGIESVPIKIGIVIYSIFYVLMCIYLIIHTLASMTNPDGFINSLPFVQNYIVGQSMTEFHLDRSYETADSRLRTPSRYTSTTELVH